MKNKLIAVLVAILGSTAACAADGLVAHWTFDDGKGDVLHDRSGKGNHGTIHGAKWVKLKKGCALLFDGRDDYVDCVSSPMVDVAGPITVSAWVCPAEAPDASVARRESGIVGKHFASHFLTYNIVPECLWHIRGSNNCRAPVAFGSWSHIVGTFDGTTVRLYVNGTRAYSGPAQPTPAGAGGRLFIGCIYGAPGAQDAIRTDYFRGMIDEVRVYDRALPEKEVRLHHQAEADMRTVVPVTPFRRVEIGTRIRTKVFVLTVGENGDMQIEVGNDSYVLESSFSYPGADFGRNTLSQGPRNSETDWTPETSTNGKEIVVRAKGRYYSLVRRIRESNSRIEIRDTLTNLTAAPLGIIVENKVICPHVFKQPPQLPARGAKSLNPSIFLSQKESHFGILAEDNFSRIRFEPFCF